MDSRNNAAAGSDISAQDSREKLNFAQYNTSWDDEEKKGAKAFMTETVSKHDVVRAWNAAEFDQFSMRATCLSPSTTFMELPLRLKARMWKYVSEVMPYYAELPDIVLGGMVRGGGERYMRVKEMFESAEVRASLRSPWFLVPVAATLCARVYVCL